MLMIIKINAIILAIGFSVIYVLLSFSFTEISNEIIKAGIYILPSFGSEIHNSFNLNFWIPIFIIGLSLFELFTINEINNKKGEINE